MCEWCYVMATARPGLGRTALKVLPVLAKHGRRSRRWFGYGSAAAIGVVVSRLVLPWPLREVAEWQVDAGTMHAFGPLELGGIDYIVAMGIVFLLVILSLGLFDFLNRLFYARFVIGMVRDLRNSVFKSVLGLKGEERRALTSRANSLIAEDDELGDEADEGEPSDSRRRSGDLVSRLVSDTARLKSGAQSFLVHVLTNSLLFVGIVIVLCMIDLMIGLIFAAAAGGAALVTAWAAQRVFQASTRLRAKEGKLAEHIEAAVRNPADDDAFSRINASSGNHEASQTRLQGVATWSAHMFFGFAVLGSLWVGAHGVEAGKIAVPDLVVTMMYALLIRGSFVRLARQGAKSGTMMAAALRLVQLLENPASSRIQIDLSSSRTHRDRLDPIHDGGENSVRSIRRLFGAH